LALHCKHAGTSGGIITAPTAPASVDAPWNEVYSKTALAEATGRHPHGQAHMNLPNSLTLLRIFFVPVLIVILLTRSPNVEVMGFSMHFEVWGVLILLLAAATDWADGYLARRRLQVTTLGILLDPIADKLLISAAFIALVDMHLVKAWMVVIIIGREFTVLGLRNIASAEGFTIEASTLGKTKMILQVCAVAIVIVGARHPSFKPLALILLWLVVISALVSAAQYFLRFWSHVDDSIKQRRKLRMLEAHKKSQDAVPF
jgi:CDP-diacylglycerol---glycerol-3-phosphate 3-phosphatidyltransferase